MTAGGGRTLVVRFAELERMESELRAAHDALLAQVGSIFDGVNATITGWEPGTASRDAHDAGQRRLQAGVDRLAAALDRVSGTLAELRESAREAEVRNVALID